MNLPLLLLGLYAGLLALSLVFASWGGHSYPPPDAARRVTHAGERVVLLHLVAPGKLAAAALLLLSALGALSTIWWPGPPFALFLAPIVCTALVLGAVYFSCTRLLRTAGQVVGVHSSDQRVILTSRSALSAVMCAEATVSLVLLGLVVVVSPALGPAIASRMVLLAAMAIGMCAVVFARALASALMSGQPAETQPGPNPGSLAQLVARAFHGPGLRLLALVSLSAFGHYLLLLPADPGELSAELWLYPHLLRMMGLVATFFGTVVVRSSEGEASHLSWARGGLVSLLLVVAGAWALSTELPPQWAQPVPAGLTYFFLSAMIFLWVAAATNRQEVQAKVGAIPLQRLPATLTFLGLLAALVFAIELLPSASKLPSSSFLRLVAAGGLALAPLSVLWLVVRDLNQGSRHVHDLSYLPRDGIDESPSERFAVLSPTLSLVILASAIGGILLVPELDEPRSLLHALGWFAGALVSWALVGLTERMSDSSTGSIEQLVGRHQSHWEAADKLNLELAIEYSREATLGGSRYLLLALSPLLLALSLSFVVPAAQLKSLILGLALGTAFLGLGLDWTLSTAVRADRRALGALSHVASLCQALWLVALGMHLS